MKKTIIIITLIILSTILTRVNASATDVTYIENIQLFTEPKTYASVAGNPLCTNGEGATKNCNFDFAYNFNNNYNFTRGEGYFLLVPFQYMISNDNETTSVITKFQPSAQIFDSNGTGYFCQIENGMVICPLTNNKTYVRINIRGTAYYNILTANIRWNLHNWASIERNVLIQGNQETTNAIEEQTEQQQQQHDEIMDTNTTYNHEASEELNGTEELDNYSNAEESLMNSLDFSGIEDLNITINPNASAFIWNIADRLRTINPAIILLMTSMLGMGIIKMILNR